jgi:hypothetical protein
MADRRQTPEVREQLVAAVRQHAVAHYDEGGWDFVVEAFSDGAIIAEIGEARTPAGAIRKMRPIVGYYAEQQADARISAF